MTNSRNVGPDGAPEIRGNDGLWIDAQRAAVHAEPRTAFRRPVCRGVARRLARWPSGLRQPSTAGVDNPALLRA